MAMVHYIYEEVKLAEGELEGGMDKLKEHLRTQTLIIYLSSSSFPLDELCDTSTC